MDTKTLKPGQPAATVERSGIFIRGRVASISGRVVHFDAKGGKPAGSFLVVTYELLTKPGLVPVELNVSLPSASFRGDVSKSHTVEPKDFDPVVGEGEFAEAITFPKQVGVFGKNVTWRADSIAKVS